MGMQRNIRAPKGFFGMRGKKDYDRQFQEKRALLGIQQVGLKNFFFLLNLTFIFYFFQQNLNNLRERTRFVEPQSDDNDGYPSYLPKRAPSQGFFGMRGKKFGDYDMRGTVSDKRAPVGFMGMRGKKSGPDSFDDEEIDDPQLFDYNFNGMYQSDKRAPSGFLGMRGKKSMGDLMFR